MPPELSGIAVTDLRRQPPQRSENEPDPEETVLDGQGDQDLWSDPMFKAVHAVWYALRPGEDLLPSRDRFRPAMIAPWLDRIVFTRVVDGGRDFLLSICGEHVDARLGRPQMNKSLVRLNAPEEGSQIVSAYRRIVRQRSPGFFRFDYVGPIRGITSTCELFLPFADDDDESLISHVLVAIRFERDVPVENRQTRWGHV